VKAGADGTPVTETCRKRGHLFSLEAKFDGLLSTDMHRQKQVEGENVTLRKVVARA
jgi:hypothetical protein